MWSEPLLPGGGDWPRAGRPHTLYPYTENPPDRILQPDDIAFADFGPIFEEFEADLGRTYVLDKGPDRLRLAAASPRCSRPAAAISPRTPTSPVPSSTPRSHGRHVPAVMDRACLIE